ncbi:hypothetical protein [Kribbella sp. CA-293567]|uniref:hypothetical protein n=1 Tax=Kribbella sp. CA-293567 TaxID=3002436 RepID=UPI0022DE6E88|nr:hypothetical protein [Kribbella sp. CA-293567]WBQ02944.1 hypothetical protein OX958_23525 [Kribbella sp. CA-293567]
MSEAVRNELADAANTVEGVKVAPYYVQATKPGHGSVQLARIEYPNIFGGEAYWEVLVLLPSDVVQAQKRAELLIPLLVAALADHMTVTGATFGRTQLEAAGAGQPCVLIAGHREQE